MREKEPSVLPLESLRQEPQDPGPLVWAQEQLLFKLRLNVWRRQNPLHSLTQESLRTALLTLLLALR